MSKIYNFYEDTSVRDNPFIMTFLTLKMVLIITMVQLGKDEITLRIK